MSNKMHCSQCGSDAEPVVILKGNTAVQIILWCALIVPGFFYSIWREASKKVVCGVCGSTDVTEVFPADHPAQPPSLADEHPAVEQGHLYSEPPATKPVDG